MDTLKSFWNWLEAAVIAPFIGFFGDGVVFVITNLTTVLGFLLALIIIRRMFTERRNPSNFFAWFLFIVFIPTFGVPLYFLLGGRKSRTKARLKRNVQQSALALSETSGAEPSRINGPPRDAVYSGNHFELLPDGQTAFRRLCAEIEQAESCIHIATYILGNDPTGNTVVDLLAKRAREGVTVRLLLDSLGSWNKTRAARYKIRRAGGEVAMFMPVLPIQTHTSSNLRNHRKIAIFDHYRAITGGQNIDTRFLGADESDERFHDFGVVTQGPAVAYLNRTFIADWAFATKEPPEKHRDLLRHVPEEAGNSTIEVVASGPDIEGDPLWEHIIRIIQEFKENLTIVTPYFVPDEVIFRSIAVKAHTGRSIRLIMPLRSNHPVTDVARHYYLRELDKAGVEIFFYTPRMLHGKLILADNKVALVGSANIDMRSLFVNFEIGLLHYSKPDIETLAEWAGDLLPHCISFREAVRAGKGVPSKWAEDLVNLVTPML